jgi:hypothetical protein
MRCVGNAAESRRAVHIVSAQTETAVLALVRDHECAHDAIGLQPLAIQQTPPYLHAETFRQGSTHPTPRSCISQSQEYPRPHGRRGFIATVFKGFCKEEFCSTASTSCSSILTTPGPCPRNVQANAELGTKTSFGTQMLLILSKLVYCERRSPGSQIHRKHIATFLSLLAARRRASHHLV